MCFWWRVRGSVDRFPSSAQRCCFKLRVYQRLIWKNGCIWGLSSIIWDWKGCFLPAAITFDGSLLKTPLGKARPAFSSGSLSLSDCFWHDSHLLIVPQPFVHVVHYFSLCLFVVGVPQKFLFFILLWEKFIFFGTIGMSAAAFCTLLFPIIEYESTLSSPWPPSMQINGGYILWSDNCCHGFQQIGKNCSTLWYLLVLEKLGGQTVF